MEERRFYFKINSKLVCKHPNYKLLHVQPPSGELTSMAYLRLTEIWMRLWNFNKRQQWLWLNMLFVGGPCY